MKSIVAVLILFMISKFSFAQNSYNDLSITLQNPPMAVSPLFKSKEVEPTFSLFKPQRGEEKPPGVVKKTVGQTLTIVGSAAMLIGFSIWDDSADDPVVYNSNGSYSYHQGYNVGASLAAHGIIMTAIGVPFWIVGAHQYNRYKREQGLSFQMKGTVGSLTYRF